MADSDSSRTLPLVTMGDLQAAIARYLLKKAAYKVGWVEFHSAHFHEYSVAKRVTLNPSVRAVRSIAAKITELPVITCKSQLPIRARKSVRVCGP